MQGQNVSWEKKKTTAESWKRMREPVNSARDVWREIFSEAGFEATFKGIWSQAVPELRDTSRTSRQNSTAG